MIDRYSRPKLVEPLPLAFHLSSGAEGENAGIPLFYELIGGYDPRSGKVLYLGRVCDAESGRMLHELPYGSTDPKIDHWKAAAAFKFCVDEAINRISTDGIRAAEASR